MINKKYSIIIPVNNVIAYLHATIGTIISQNYKDYELIISDDSSTDGTAEYIDSLAHPNIRILHTQNRLTVAGHFDWALSHAIGEWCMFVGGDDGLQPYFFQLADRLTEIATDKNIRAIASRRAYFFGMVVSPIMVIWQFRIIHCNSLKLNLPKRKCINVYIQKKIILICHKCIQLRYFINL